MSLSAARQSTITQLLAHGELLMAELRRVDKALVVLGHSASFVNVLSTRPEGLPSIQEVLESVSVFSGVSALDIVSRSRIAQVFEARIMVYWFASKMAKESSTRIGHAVGGRDHGAVLSGLTRIQCLFETDPKFRDRLLRAQSALCSMFQMKAERSVEGLALCDLFTPCTSAP